MTKRGYGLLAGIAGAAFAAWYWRGRRAQPRTDAHDKGEVIFRNTPTSEGVL